MVFRGHCLADQESAVALRSFLPLRPVRMEIEHLGLNQRCKTAGARMDHVYYQLIRLTSPKDFHLDLASARAINGVFCKPAHGLDSLLISEPRPKTLDQDKGYFENVCIEQYTDFLFSAVFAII